MEDRSLTSVSKLVAGLRIAAPPSEVRVYRANPDGTKGELLRIEEPKERKHNEKKRL